MDNGAGSSCRWGPAWAARGQAMWGPVCIILRNWAPGPHAGSTAPLPRLSCLLLNLPGQQQMELWLQQRPGVQSKYQLPCCPILSAGRPVTHPREHPRTAAGVTPMEGEKEAATGARSTKFRFIPGEAEESLARPGPSYPEHPAPRPTPWC